MFVGIVGPPCSGKHALATLLAEKQGYQRLCLFRDSFASSSTGRSESTGSESRGSGQHSGSTPCKPTIVFSSIDAMLEYVTLHWSESFVTCDVHSVQGVVMLRKRPFFLLLSIESPMMVRYRRCVSRCRQRQEAVPSLEDFVDQSDSALYSTSFLLQEPRQIEVEEEKEEKEEEDTNSNLEGSVESLKIKEDHPMIPAYKLLSMSDVSLLNPFQELDSLYSALMALEIENEDLLRPSWDSYFMHLANLAARRSNCMKRRVGCVLVRERRVMATGYNGTPKKLVNCNEGGCQRCNSGASCGSLLDRCLCMHAEENALLEAGRERVGTGATIYCNTCPCLGCAIKIVQVGVSEVVYSESYGMDEMTAKVFLEAGVLLRQHGTPGIKLDASSQ